MRAGDKTFLLLLGRRAAGSRYRPVARGCAWCSDFDFRSDGEVLAHRIARRRNRPGAAGVRRGPVRRH